MPSEKPEICAACGKPAQGNYSIHRDGFFDGPEVPLCDDCGKDEKPSCEILWGAIAARQEEYRLGYMQGRGAS